ncbi:MAG: class I SAM-dependent methyltransferase [Paracoccaceae bacterium]|nr:class I SAM-dependent methyltransferase [Paracoccaceae bacterium]
MRKDDAMGFPDLDPTTSTNWCKLLGDWRRPDISERYDLLWDETRAFGQLWPRPHPDEISAFYVIDGYHTHSVQGPSLARPGVSQRVLTRLAWAADKGSDPDQNWWKQTLGTKPRKVLEIGSGRGAHSAKIAALGHSVFGVEPDRKARRIAQDHGFQVENGTAENLPALITAKKYDAVVFMHVLEHCLHPFQALKNSVGLLNPGGIVVVEVPNNASTGCSYFGPLWAWLDVPRHLNFFTETSLGALFDAASLTKTSVSYRGYTRQFSADWRQTQAQIAEAFGMARDARVKTSSYWSFLARTAFARPSRKYDSVRIVGRLPT